MDIVEFWGKGVGKDWWPCDGKRRIGQLNRIVVDDRLIMNIHTDVYRVVRSAIWIVFFTHTKCTLFFFILLYFNVCIKCTVFWYLNNGFWYHGIHNVYTWILPVFFKSRLHLITENNLECYLYNLLSGRGYLVILELLLNALDCFFDTAINLWCQLKFQ